ncbi:CPBP family intramembrane glutamic endopeptidase [Sporolactobacillus kofuensis]|uniref:CPBP family intramembrane glutamic endopeptidase n=1 Tax=Sporolactobacillus kofuensis TaxID=269672 RepID=A0ABW1WHT4_9BACL|nr:CPBP family intramembrane glutamic endopeptidase [Sporolactobacillus kofuensis]MCO7176623.1 CPBP family intramembrane metalloprotease [Sporolactobacillus kofuensis]
MRASMSDEMTDKEIRHVLYQSQGLLLILDLGLCIFFVETLPLNLWFHVESKSVALGLGVGIIMAALQGVVDYILPTRWGTEDHLDERLFCAFPLPALVLTMAVVAFIEEVLFRGLVQHFIGFVATCVVFTFIHFRYLKKPRLLITVAVFSVCLGSLYLLTESLIAPILAHFTVNVTSGLIYKWLKNKRAK